MRLSIFTLAAALAMTVAAAKQTPLMEQSAAAESDLFSLHADLVKIPSVTGQEHDVAEYLYKYLEKSNFTVEKLPIDDGPRENIYAYRGEKRDTKVLLTSHIDTVPPFLPYEDHGDWVSGRGSSDAKASVAAQITAAKELESDDVSLLFVVGEETDGIGMKQAHKMGVKWETVIFGEPTELKLAVGHKGLILANVKASGKASHSGYPELGSSATEKLVTALYKLQNLEFPRSELLGPTTLNIGTIRGGVAANVLPAEAIATLAIRVATELDTVMKKLQDAVAEVDDVELEITGSYGEQTCDYDVAGFDTITVSYGTDIPNMSHKLYKRKYLYGPGSILVAHGPDEYVEKKDLERTVKGYKKLVKHALSA
ncbi:Zn-dependent exopeptidase [Saitoella complicata NRRL Y-17804]|uniref:Peptidase M20 dimerisation domain-containing protein n=1 Tax=Saitoella complicata (strain BCRC 22490 / CBS 7301 / JCM 7358 / NBRC 10748 / NRRL Y-17804) TaxID=698492 RepID=A0A0E9NB68_SAICN|nr:Zn-dependent exopeptidase [Saitoella complicata NRRL Y-17804]ODQ55250.1 Zn-dependent exopeptidase [Saitoella complicata NRRL Y-17804]GAO47084.1 hypothetical protein G7K_1296-t1 [Saitoella complicata NRRL Y-17804]